MFRLSLKSPKEIGAAESEEQVPLNLRRVSLFCCLTLLAAFANPSMARGQSTAAVDMSSDPATNPLCGGGGGCLQFFDKVQFNANKCTGVNSTPTTQNNPTCALTLIRPGDTVRWTMKDSTGPHGTASGQYTTTTTVADGRWASPQNPQMALNDTFTTTLNSQGVYPYFCEFHFSAMVGNVVVQDYTINVTPNVNYAYTNAPANFSATLTAFPSGSNATIATTSNFIGFQAPAYNSQVNLSCAGTGFGCSPPGATTPTTSGVSTGFTDTENGVRNVSVGIQGTGTDSSTLVKSSNLATLHVVNLSMTAPSNVTIGGNDSSNTKSSNFNVTAQGTFPAGGVTFSCEPLAGVSCSFSPPNVTPPQSATPVTVTVTTSGLAAGNHTVTIDATPGSPLDATPIKQTFTVASVGDFSMAVTNGSGNPPTITVPKNTTANFSGTLTALLGYSAANNITITCSGPGTLPPTCNGSTHTTGAGTVTLISASSSVSQSYNFFICATGNDAAAVNHCQQVILNVGGFTFGSPSSSTVNDVVGNPSSLITFPINPDPSFNATVALSLSGLPAGATFKFYPTASPQVNGATITISMTVTTTSATPPGSYPITVNGSGGGSTPSGIPLTLSVSAGASSANLGVTINHNATPNPVAFGAPLKFNFVVSNAAGSADAPTATLIISFDQQLATAPSFTGGISGACTGTGPYSCSVLAVAIGGSRTVTATLAAPFLRSIQANAQVSSADTDTAQANNTTSNPANGLAQIRLKPFGLNFQVPLLP